MAQEVVVRALPRLNEIESYAEPWAVRVATNLSLDLLRRKSRQSASEVPDRAVRLDEPDVELDLRRAVRRLPERQRQVVALRLLCDLDVGATAHLLGISAGSVKRHLHRALVALRASDTLAAPAHRKAPDMGTTSRDDWTARFTRAVAPDGGWPARPWDHWRMESRAGRVARLAVVDGVPVLDAEGDEVMTGPGFDHEVVKVLPNVFDDAPEPQRPQFCAPQGLLGELLTEALTEAHCWGHTWVGDEHLGLVLARRGIGLAELPAVESAVARFYEGPYAEARVALVRARRAGQPFARDPVPKALTLPLEQLVGTAAGTDASLDEVLDLLRAQPYSLTRLLLAAG